MAPALVIDEDFVEPRRTCLALVPEAARSVGEIHRSLNQFALPSMLFGRSAMHEKLAMNTQCEPFNRDLRDLPRFRKAWRAYLQLLGASESTKTNSTLVAMLKQSVDVTPRAKWVQMEEKAEELQYSCM